MEKPTIDNLHNKKEEGPAYPLSWMLFEKAFGSSRGSAVFGDTVAQKLLNANRRAVMTNWFHNPIFGQPRFIDALDLRDLAGTTIPSTIIRTITEEFSQLEWRIIEATNYKGKKIGKVTQSRIDEIEDKLRYNLNKNNENLVKYVGKQWLTDIMEVDSGILVKEFSVNSYKDTGKMLPELKPRGQRDLVNVWCRDGASFLKNIDKHGNLGIDVPSVGNVAYWQYSYTSLSYPIPFSKDEISFTIRNPRSNSPYGHAPLEAAIDPVKTVHNSIRFNKELIERDSVPRGILSIKNTSEKEIERIQANWKEQMQGAPREYTHYTGLGTVAGSNSAFGREHATWYKLPIVGREMQWLPFMPTQREMQYIESMGFYVNLIASCFLITPDEMSFMGGSTKAVAYEMGQIYKRKSFIPSVRSWEETITRDILSEFFQEGEAVPVRFEFDIIDKLEELREWELDERKIKTGVMTINEYRKENGLDPLPWGDDQPNKTIMSQFSNQFGGPTEHRNPKENPGVQNVDGEEDTKPKKKSEIEIEKASNLTSARDLTIEEVAFYKDLKKVKNKTLKEILEKIRTMMKAMDTSTLDTLRRIVSQAFDLIFAQATVGLVTDHVNAIYRKGISIAENKMDLDAGVSPYDLEVINAYRNNTLELVTSLSDDLKKKVNLTLLNAYENKLSYTKTVQMIKEELGDTADFKIERIVRTEGSRIMTKAQINTYKKLGVDKLKWITAGDDRVSQICRQAEKGYISPDAGHGRSGQIGTKEGIYDIKDADGLIPLHPNCRSDWLPVMD